MTPLLIVLLVGVSIVLAAVVQRVRRRPEDRPLISLVWLLGEPRKLSAEDLQAALDAAFGDKLKRVEVKREDINNWMVFDGGQVVGGFSTRVLGESFNDD